MSEIIQIMFATKMFKKVGSYNENMLDAKQNSQSFESLSFQDFINWVSFSVQPHFVTLRDTLLLCIQICLYL